jgi:hypothetical protein
MTSCSRWLRSRPAQLLAPFDFDEQLPRLPTGELYERAVVRPLLQQ